MHSLLRNTGLSYLLLLMLLKTLAIPAISLHYQLNKAWIAANLCENKNKPAMNCNGKCHLRKQLAKTTASETPSGTKITTTTPAVDYCNELQELDLQPVTQHEVSFAIQQQAACPDGHKGTIFHPPIA